MGFDIEGLGRVEVCCTLASKLVSIPDAHPVNCPWGDQPLEIDGDGAISVRKDP